MWTIILTLLVWVLSSAWIAYSVVINKDRVAGAFAVVLIWEAIVFIAYKLAMYLIYLCMP